MTKLIFIMQRINKRGKLENIIASNIKKCLEFNSVGGFKVIEIGIKTTKEVDPDIILQERALCHKHKTDIEWIKL